MNNKYIYLIFLIVLCNSVYSIEISETKGEIPEYISEYLTNGSQANANVNTQTGYGDWYYQPPNGTVTRLSRIIITIADETINNAGDYGAITNGVSNGVAFYTYINGTYTRIDGGINFTTNGDYHKIAYDMAISNLGSGLDYVGVRWSFDKSGTYIRLNGSLGERIVVRLSDDFSSLSEHYFLVQGYKEKELNKPVVQVEQVNDNMLYIIIFQISLILFFILIGLPFKEGFLKLLSWGVALIELLITSWLVYINEVGGSIDTILYFNSISMLIVGGTLGFLSILMIQTRLMLDDTNKDDGYTKFIFRDPRNK